ncbi:odorant receptor 82a-like [Topomyia yanbarensis]|uniref:odorant receptor 82a-like n=1 Tax=Topomyia yanbarensis TaxID=2498891 RepID=UPI00273C2152|nr:odorant receptor 82a-like [Topomyia yanbarensis]
MVGWESFLRVQLICLSLVGIEQNGSVSNRVLFYFCFISMAVMDSAATLFALENRSNIVLVCDCLGPLFTCYLAIVKLFYLNVNRNELWEIINKLRRLSRKADSREVEMIEQNSKIDQRLATTFLTTTVITGSLFVAAAFVKGIYSTIFKNDAHWNFPISLSFPFDTSHPLVFGFLFAWCTAAIFNVVCASVSSDAIFAGLASSLVTHFRCIGLRFEDRDFIERDESLVELIEYHKLILNLSRKLMSSFRMNIFQNLLVASVLLCVLSFQLVMFLGSSTMLIYFLYVMAIVIQISFFSYYGSLIAHESTLVADAIYCSNWYEASPKTRKILLQCIARAQVPVNIKAGFMVASLPTMRAILNSAGSYVALLLSFT